jgi:hypothetical protein
MSDDLGRRLRQFLYPGNDLGDDLFIVYGDCIPVFGPTADWSG